MDENIRTIEQLQYNIKELADLLLDGLVDSIVLSDFKDSIDEAFDKYVKSDRQ